MDSKREKPTLISRILGFLDRTMKDHVGAYAAQAAYFLIMSFIPFILFLTTLLRYTSVTYNMLREVMVQMLPPNLQPFVLQIVADVYRRSDAVLPITALTALWSAGKGVQAITNGLNIIYHVKETRNWLINRIYSVFYTLLFSAALIVSLSMLVLGEQVQRLIVEAAPILGRVLELERLMGERTHLAFFVLFAIFLLLYKVLPNRKATFRSQVPGALITSVAWMIFSYFFSLYFEMSTGFTNMYGNMAALIILMLWMDILMNLMLYGAEINIYFEKEFRRLAAVLRKKRALWEESKKARREEKGRQRIEERRQKQLLRKEKKELSKHSDSQDL